MVCIRLSLGMYMTPRSTVIPDWTYFSFISEASLRTCLRMSSLVFLTNLSSPYSLAFIKLSKRAEGNLASIGKTSPSGSLIVNSTRLPLPGMTSALLSYWLG